MHRSAVSLLRCFFLIFISFLLLLHAEVKFPGGGKSAAFADETPESQDFDESSAFQHLRQLVNFGPRPCGSAAAGKAQAYIIAQLRQLKVQVNEQDFSGETPLGARAMKNILAVIPGPSSEIIIIGAHYDTKYFKDIEFVGANDGASGPAVLLELARCLNGRNMGPTVWLVFFDGEEALVEWGENDGLYGSRHFVQELKRTGQLPNVKAMLLLDMVADADLSIGLEMNSTGWIREIVWENAGRLGYTKHFTSAAIQIEDDHTPFLNEKIPALDIIDMMYGPNSRSNEFWHTPEDTLDKVSPNSLKVVGEVVLSSLPEIATSKGRLRR